MDLEHLTKHQIVLLTLLVSFVTSIATGIVTVSLMNQAPPTVARTINQIVERTVETVAQPAAAVVAAPTTKTVVLTNDDLTAQSVASVRKAVVRIVDTAAPDTLVARGVIIDKKGTALTDRSAIVSSGAKNLEAILSDGTMAPLVVRKDQATSTDTLVVDIAVGTSTGFAPAALADVSKVALGQTLIRIGGTGDDTVGSGVVAALPHEGLIESSVSSVTPGSIIMTLFGEIVGLTTGDSAGKGADFYSTVIQPTAAPSQPATTQPATSSS